MGDKRSEIAAELEKNLEETLALFRSLSPDQLGVMVYDDGPEWTVRQVLAHFITIERSMQWLFRNILSGGPGSPEDFDLDRFNATQPRKLDGLPMEELTARYRSVRGETVAIVRGMREEDLERTGRHPFHGTGRLERFIRWAYEHARLHETDIRKALGES